MRNKLVVLLVCCFCLCSSNVFAARTDYIEYKGVQVKIMGSYIKIENNEVFLPDVRVSKKQDLRPLVLSGHKEDFVEPVRLDGKYIVYNMSSIMSLFQSCLNKYPDELKKKNVFQLVATYGSGLDDYYGFQVSCFKDLFNKPKPEPKPEPPEPKPEPPKPTKPEHITSLDGILNKIISVFSLLKASGLKLIQSAIKVGVVFLGAKWLWKKTKQWMSTV